MLKKFDVVTDDNGSIGLIIFSQNGHVLVLVDERGGKCSFCIMANCDMTKIGVL